FALDELLARVHALGRRAPSESDGNHICIGDLQIDVANRRVTRAGERAELSPREFEVLLIFAREPGRTFSRDEICERIWDRQHEYDTRTVEIFVMRLRKKLDRAGAETVIATVRGSGYVMHLK
ncbi:MAG: winged helix-turn-helix domain-containing protein, partial [Luteolibacter sp.]